MSWHYLPGLAAEFSAVSCSDGEPSALSKSKSTHGKSSSKDSATGTSPSSPSGTTSRPSTGDPGVDSFLLSVAGSRVLTSPAREKEQASKASSRASGEKWPVSWVRYDRDTSSWRTRQCLLLGGLAEFSGTWPRWGTMRAGECWALDMPERLTDATESGLWPTPSASLHNLTEQPGSFLDRQERWKGTYSNSAPLTVAVKIVSPGAKPAGTFGASGAYAIGPSADARETMTETSSTARELWPTAAASDWKGSSKDGQRRGQLTDPAMGAIPAGAMLSPDWVEWLMGWPIGWTAPEAISDSGWFSSAWWDEEPCPRVTTIKTNRVSRLKAIGNGQVPACVVMAWSLLSKG